MLHIRRSFDPTLNRSGQPEPRVFVALGAGGVETRTLPGVAFEVGLFVDRTSGSSELVLYPPE